MFTVFVSVSLIISFRVIPLLFAASSPWNQTNWSGGTSEETFQNNTDTYLSITETAESEDLTTETEGILTLKEKHNWYDHNWLSRKEIVINYDGEQAENYLIQLFIDTEQIISGGKMQEDCSDLRFSDQNGDTSLDFQIIAGCNTSSTEIWVKIPSLIQGNNTIYLNYNNPEADSITNYLDISKSYDTGNGSDSSISVAGEINLNSVNRIEGRVCADGGDMVHYNIINIQDSNSVQVEKNVSEGCLSPGDEILIINLQGTPSDNVNTGNWETLTVESVSGDIINFTTNKKYFYGSSIDSDDNIGTAADKQKVQLQRVPNYSEITISSTGSLTADAWDGTDGGVLFFRVNGSLNIEEGGTINMTGKGYRGGIAKGYQGESYPGTGGMSNTPNGGGGGSGGMTSGAHAGGGGGGYGTAGAKDTGLGGLPYGSATLDQLFLGSGGGVNHDICVTGGKGGGIIFVSSENITSSGSIISNGTDGQSCGTNGKNGAGSGGSIYLSALNINIGTDNVYAAGGTIVAAGGAGRIRIDSNELEGSSTPQSYQYLLPNIELIGEEEGIYRLKGTLTSNIFDAEIPSD